MQTSNYFKKITYDVAARTRLKAGVDAVANAVKVTLGPRGRNVIIERPGKKPQITKDGVTVAKEICLEDNIENLGAQIIKGAATEAADLAGDGTTTATVLAQSIISLGFAYCDEHKKSSRVAIQSGIDMATKAVVEFIKGIAIPVEVGSAKIKQIATISTNGDESLGEMVAMAISKAGPDGIVSAEESKNYDTS